MSLEQTGKLVMKGDTQQVSEKFKKREFVIEIAEEINGNVYTNFGKFQLVQNKCDIIDRFGIGAMVKVAFNVKGNSYVDKKDGQTKYITNLDAWRVESMGDGGQQHHQPAQNSAQQYASTSAAPVYQAPTFNPSPEVIDDLPF
jgi:hypothetical protein